MELRPGMRISATKVVESPRTEITESNVVGVAPSMAEPKGWGRGLAGTGANSSGPTAYPVGS